MAIIKATCDICGDVDLAPSAVRVVVAVQTNVAKYIFSCAGCQTEVEKEADEEVVRLLKGVGVRIIYLPAEVFTPHTGPALTVDDVEKYATYIQTHNICAEDFLPNS